MSHQLRHFIQSKIIQSINQEIFILPNFKLKNDYKNGLFLFELPLKTQFYDINNKAQCIVDNCTTANDIIKNVSIESNNDNNSSTLLFNIDRNEMIKNTLTSNINNIKSPSVNCNNNKFIVEFSSPNIAKPFHIGHLRSTIIGNYISNLLKFINKDVIKLNYLGDWGTQIGLVLIGMKLNNITDDMLKHDAINQLYKAYVHANKLSESDSEIRAEALNIFEKLEKGDAEITTRWELIKQYTLTELEKTYKRIGITFDEYIGESNYSYEKINNLIVKMKEMGLWRRDPYGRLVMPLNEKRIIPLIKSNGSTLYSVRDIAAAIERADKYHFDKMYYIVENGQFDHFLTLKMALSKMDLPWADRLEHVKFGKIHGMSTRKGTAVLLSSLLDEAQSLVKEKQLNSSRTKVSCDESDNSSDILGISAIITQDLKQRRNRDYEFNWDRALDLKGETGIRLQYSHCRLANLKENCGAILPEECDPSLLEESIVNELVGIINQFDEAVISSYETLEACSLTKYLFHLSHTINKTLEQLRVKDQPSDLASQRLLLYHVSKNILNTGMKILGLTPLNKM